MLQDLGLWSMTKQHMYIYYSHTILTAQYMIMYSYEGSVIIGIGTGGGGMLKRSLESCIYKSLGHQTRGK